ncbi:MAG: glutathione S-transferase family protein [Pseudomonadota bacterium]
MITLHHLEYSQSFRILWLLEELGIEYELKKYDRNKVNKLAPPEYKALSPLGSAPVIEHEGLVLAESSAIIDYILDLYPSETLRPEKGATNRARYLFWMHASNGSMMPLMLLDTLFTLMRQRSPFVIKPAIVPMLKLVQSQFVKPRMTALLDVAEKDLSEAPWFGGDEITAADIAMCYPMEGASTRGYFDSDRPNCMAWMRRMYAHPSFKKAKELDGREQMVLPL